MPRRLLGEVSCALETLGEGQNWVVGVSGVLSCTGPGSLCLAVTGSRAAFGPHLPSRHEWKGPGREGAFPRQSGAVPTPHCPEGAPLNPTAQEAGGGGKRMLAGPRKCSPHHRDRRLQVSFLLKVMVECLHFLRNMFLGCNNSV